MLQRTYDKYRLLDVKTRSKSCADEVSQQQHDEDVTEEESRLEDDMSCHDNIQMRSGNQQSISPFDQNSNKQNC